jgi:predicted ATPase
MLEKTTNGNVLFIIEMLRALAETAGTLAQIGSMEIPTETEFYQPIMDRRIWNRLNRLPVEYRALLDLAAVSGLTLNIPVLRLLNSNSHDFDEWLKAGAESAIFEVRANEWCFAHEKIRSTLLANSTTSVDKTRETRANRELKAGTKGVANVE